MTRRERILTALNGGVPDRPPIAFDSPAAMAMVLEHYGARDKNDLYRVAGIDGFSVWEWNAVMGRYTGPLRHAADGSELDFWGNCSQHEYGLWACEWRRFYKPCWERAFRVVHAHGAKVWFHSCGYIRPLLEDLLEVGIDCWNPFAPYVKDNDHQRLADWRKKRRLVLDGGVNQLLLVYGTPQQVASDTRQVLERFAPAGGLLIGPSQVLTPDMKIENIHAMFQTMVEYRG